MIDPPRSRHNPSDPALCLPSASIDALKKRCQLLNEARRFLTERGYWEVETPILSRDVCVDRHLEPLIVESIQAGAEPPLYLQTSPEFGMKRLLSAGAGDIFQITRAFRGGEVGPLHNPEFTIVEWYRVGGGYGELMDEVGALVGSLLGTPDAERVSYRDAFRRHADIDPFEADDRLLCARARAEGFADASADRDQVLNFLLAALVEPCLGIDRPTFLFDFPASQAALAKVRSETPPVAERFELYIAGVELCNGYQELTDPIELRRRNAEQNALRTGAGKRPLPIESRLLSAMQHGLPECAGVALGFDRVAMLATGARSLDAVLPFPIERA